MKTRRHPVEVKGTITFEFLAGLTADLTTIHGSNPQFVEMHPADYFELAKEAEPVDETFSKDGAIELKHNRFLRRGTIVFVFPVKDNPHKWVDDLISKTLNP